MNQSVWPEIDPKRCNQCSLCVELCPTGAVEMTPEGPLIARPADCDYCAQCEAYCPQGAITCSYEIVWGEGDA
jgi:MinD superfamily P-loop ATPase